MMLTLDVIWLLMPCSTSFNRPDWLWKREASASADDRAAWRDGIAAGLEATSWIPLKKLCKAGDRPDAGSASKLSICLICA